MSALGTILVSELWLTELWKGWQIIRRLLQGAGLVVRGFEGWWINLDPSAGEQDTWAFVQALLSPGQAPGQAVVSSSIKWGVWTLTKGIFQFEASRIETLFRVLCKVPHPRTCLPQIPQLNRRKEQEQTSFPLCSSSEKSRGPTNEGVYLTHSSPPGPLTWILFDVLRRAGGI